MTRVNVDLANTISLENSGIAGAQATQVGSPPVWEDNSDATYVELDGAYFGPSNPSFISSAQCLIPVQTLSGLSPSNPEFKLYASLRLNGVQAGLPFLRFELERVSSEGAIFMSETPTLPDSPSWVTVEMVGDIVDLWEAPSDYQVRIDAASMTIGGTGDVEIRSWRIYEVQLYFEVPTRVAASCRNFPADTINAPGGSVRQYPPSRAVARGRGLPAGYL